MTVLRRRPDPQGLSAAENQTSLADEDRRAGEVWKRHIRLAGLAAGLVDTLLKPAVA